MATPPIPDESLKRKRPTRSAPIRGKTIRVPVEFTPSELAILDAIVTRRGGSRSAVLRQLVLDTKESV